MIVLFHERNDGDFGDRGPELAHHLPLAHILGCEDDRLGSRVLDAMSYQIRWKKRIEEYDAASSLQATEDCKSSGDLLAG